MLTNHNGTGLNFGKVVLTKFVRFEINIEIAIDCQLTLKKYG